MQKNQRDGFILMILATAGYGFLPILTKNIFNTTPLTPIELVAWRFVFAVPIIWIGLYMMGKLPINTSTIRWKQIIGLGMIYSAAAFLASLGLDRLPASTYVVLFYTYPVMVAVISAFLGKPLSIRGWVALGLTAIGVLLTVPDLGSIGGASSGGILIALANALAMAVYYVLSGRILGKSISPSVGTALVITTTGCILVPLAVSSGLTTPDSKDAWMNLLALSVISTAMPILLINTAIQKIGASSAAIISTIQPAQTILLSVILLGEIVTSSRWLGAGIIIISVLLAQLRPRMKPVPTPVAGD